MPAAIRIKAGKYGNAIGLLLGMGGAFQTRHERTLIVNAAQKRALEQAGLVEDNKFLPTRSSPPTDSLPVLSQS